MRGLFCTASFDVVLDDVLDVGGGVFVLSRVTLRGDALATLCGGLLFRILVSVFITSEWRVLSFVADGNIFRSAFRRWLAMTSVLSASEMVGTVQWTG